MLNIYQKNLNFGETNKNEMHLSLQRMENRSKRPQRFCTLFVYIVFLLRLYFFGAIKYKVLRGEFFVKRGQFMLRNKRLKVFYLCFDFICMQYTERNYNFTACLESIIAKFKHFHRTGTKEYFFLKDAVRVRTLSIHKLLLVLEFANTIISQPESGHSFFLRTLSISYCQQ